MSKNIIITSGKYPTHGIFSLIKYISYSLLSNSKFKNNYSLKILIFKESYFIKIKKIIWNIILSIKNFFLDEKKRIHKFSYPAKDFVEENNDLKKYCNYFTKESEYKNFNPDFVFPLISAIDERNFLAAGYIYDLQHCDLPKLFSKKEVKMRNNLFKRVLRENDTILVNSKFVKKGILKTYGIKSNKINVIPFLPFVYDKKKNIPFNIKEKYKINRNYFLICNRFWKHKNHEIVFKAFKKFLEYQSDYQLICTGDTSDTRFPFYFKELNKKYHSLISNNKIRILDIIPREDQLRLIQNSKAVIQPTLYEGGPGGFSSYEAISYGKKLIISDIPINREIKSKNTIFFNPNSHSNLTKLLLKVSKQKKNNIYNYKKNLKNNKKKLGNYFLGFITKTLLYKDS